MMKKYSILLLFILGSLFPVYGQTCDTPTAVSATNVTGTTATINWLYSGPATSWEVLISLAGSPAPTASMFGIVTNVNPHIITGLTPCTAYDVYVRTVCDATTKSSWSAPVSFGQSSTISATAVLSASLTCTSPATVNMIASGGSGSFEYAIAAPAAFATPYQSSNVFTITTGGTYTFVVRDRVLGCLVSPPAIVITQPVQPVLTFSVSGNTVVFNAAGGSAPYRFSLNGGPFTSSGIFTNLPPGVYTGMVMDTNGCITTVTFTIPPSLSVNITATLDNPTSTLMANVTGGSAPYMYQWSLNGVPITGVVTNNTLSIMGQPGVYEVTVTDINGQTATGTITIQGGVGISAFNDSISVYPDSNGVYTSAVSVLSNDFMNGLPINPNNHPDVVLTPVTIPSGFSLNPNGTISVLPGTVAGTYSLTYTICAAQNPAVCSTATATVIVANEGFLLNAFYDTNSNGTQDPGEVNFNLGQFHYELNNDGNVHSVVASSGTYYIQESNTANSYDFSFTIDPVYNAYYTVAVPAYMNVTHAAGSGVVMYNFAVTQLSHTDAFVATEPYGTPPRPGFTYVNRIYYRNSGNQTIASGRLTFTKDNAVSIVSVSQAGIVSNATGFTYDFTNLLPNESRSILVTMQVPTMPTVTLGTVLTNTTVLSNVVNDANAANNTSALSQIIVGSYDPNDKAELHGGKILHSTFTSNDYLTYTIQFENTGTYYAENVRINDILDAKLDETSIKMVSGSHPYTLSIAGNNLNWNFNGIDLLPAGKGHVTFQIKPKPGYVVGDIIPNTASIYFDFNPAIVTNTYTTEFVNSLSTDVFEGSAFTLYPNPASSFITIAMKGNASTIDRLNVIDLTGKTVITKAVNAATTVIDLSSLANGMYFVRLQSRDQEKTLKIIKE